MRLFVQLDVSLLPLTAPARAALPVAMHTDPLATMTS